MAIETRNSPQFLQLDSSEVSGWSSSGSPEGNCMASLSFVLGARLKQRPTVDAPPSFCDNQETWGLTRVKSDWPGKKRENIGGGVWTRISALTQLICPGLFVENADLDQINWRTSEFDPDNFHRNCGDPEWSMILLCFCLTKDIKNGNAWKNQQNDDVEEDFTNQRIGTV